MVSDIETLAAKVAVKQAIASTVALAEGDEQTITSNTDAKITVYSTITGEPKQILRIDAERVVGKRIPGTNRMAHWIPGMPGDAPVYKKGTVSCILHPDFDEKDGPAGFDRAWVESIGVITKCNDANPDKPARADFKSVYDRDEHARTKHRRELQTIQNALTSKRDREYQEERRLDRELAMKQADAMLALAGQNAEQKAKTTK